MKRIGSVFACVLICMQLFPHTALANMAAPAEADVGSSVTFEKHDTIAVLSEVLDITVKGSAADISAAYRMKNTSQESVSTQAMFLSPNVERSGVQVMVDGRETQFTTESYALHYDVEIATDDWRYAVLSETAEPEDLDEGQTVDSITFEMSFAPQEEYDVVVSYEYRLGGYPDYDFDAKDGKIEYLLAPAAMWKEFGGLTINLTLDKDMPVISSSNLEFTKIGTRTYQYTSDTLPEENLRIVIDENWFQNIFSTLRGPYLYMMLFMASSLTAVGVGALALIIWLVRRLKKLRR